MLQGNGIKISSVCTGHWGSKMSEGERPSSKQSTFREPNYKKITDFDAFDHVELPKRSGISKTYKLPVVENKTNDEFIPNQ